MKICHRVWLSNEDIQLLDDNLYIQWRTGEIGAFGEAGDTGLIVQLVGFNQNNGHHISTPDVDVVLLLDYYIERIPSVQYRVLLCIV